MEARKNARFARRFGQRRSAGLCVLPHARYRCGILCELSSALTQARQAVDLLIRHVWITHSEKELEGGAFGRELSGIDAGGVVRRGTDGHGIDAASPRREVDRDAPIRACLGYTGNQWSSIVKPLCNAAEEPDDGADIHAGAAFQL